MEWVHWRLHYPDNNADIVYSLHTAGIFRKDDWPWWSALGSNCMNPFSALMTIIEIIKGNIIELCFILTESLYKYQYKIYGMRFIKTDAVQSNLSNCQVEPILQTSCIEWISIIGDHFTFFKVAFPEVSLNILSLPNTPIPLAELNMETTIQYRISSFQSFLVWEGGGRVLYVSAKAILSYWMYRIRVCIFHLLHKMDAGLVFTQ